MSLRDFRGKAVFLLFGLLSGCAGGKQSVPAQSAQQTQAVQPASTDQIRQDMVDQMAHLALADSSDLTTEARYGDPSAAKNPSPRLSLFEPIPAKNQALAKDAAPVAPGAITVSAKPLNSHDPEVLINMGIAAEQRGDLAAAEKSLRAALAIDPNNDRAKIHLAQTLSRLGRKEETPKCSPRSWRLLRQIPMPEPCKLGMMHPFRLCPRHRSRSIQWSRNTRCGVNSPTRCCRPTPSRESRLPHARAPCRMRMSLPPHPRLRTRNRYRSSSSRPPDRYRGHLNRSHRWLLQQLPRQTARPPHHRLCRHRPLRRHSRRFRQRRHSRQFRRRPTTWSRGSLYRRSRRCPGWIPRQTRLRLPRSRLQQQPRRRQMRCRRCRPRCRPPRRCPSRALSERGRTSSPSDRRFGACWRSCSRPSRKRNCPPHHRPPW